MKTIIKSNYFLIDLSTAEDANFAHKSVLLIPKCNTPNIPNPLTSSDIQENNNNISENLLIDICTDSTKLDEKCVNTLELIPSTDALIEVPIKKTVRKPKLYETTTEINFTRKDNPYETISFKGKPNVAQDNNKKELNETESKLKEPYNFKLDFEKAVTPPSAPNTALTETKTTTKEAKILAYEPKELLTENVTDPSDNTQTLDEDNITKTWTDFNKHVETLDDGNYEPIDSSYFANFDLLDSEKNYNIFEKYPNIWWEGAYRNLSIVPEEDEENISLLGSLSSHKTSIYQSSPSSDRNIPNEEIYTHEFYNSGSSILKSDSLSLFSSSSDEDNKSVELETKIPKADVKLLVKSDTDNKSIEVRSVREFIKENNGKTNNGKIKFLDRKKRSQTLPNRFSESINTISNKLNNFLDKKKSSSYSFLQEPSDSEEQESGSRPSFTLQRLFVRTKDTLTENPNRELVATTKQNFPLNYDLSNEKNKPKVDLYANLPFYPCYDQYPLSKSGPVISFPNRSKSESNGAYCDWLLHKEDNREGKVDEF